MNAPVPAGTAAAPGALRLDVVAGLTAAAVVLPKAMAYATVAGLPVAVGLYTAFVPMLVYALLGTSRVLSVSSTTTLAILAGTQLGLVVPDGDPAKLITATATLTALVGAMLLLAAAAAPGLRRQLHLDAGAHRLQGRHRPGDRARPGAEAAGRAHCQARLLPRPAQRRAAPARDLAADAGGGAGDLAVLIGMERLWPHSPAPLVAVAGGIAASWFFGLQAAGVSTVGLIPQGFPSLTLPDLSLVADSGTRRAGHRADELHRDHRCRARLRRSGRPADQCQPRTVATGAANLAGALFGAMPAGGGTSQTAVVRSAGGKSQKASLVTAGAAVATMLLLAPLLGLMPHATLAAVVIVYSVGLIQPAEFRAIRKVRTMEFRWALSPLSACWCSARSRASSWRSSFR